MWDGLRNKQPWLRHPARKAAANNRFDFEVEPALEQMITAGSRYDQPAHVYWYALELLAEQNGAWLSNDCWCAMPRPSHYLEFVGAELTRAGSPEAAAIIHNAIWSPPALDLPPPQDFPAVGYLETTRIPNAIEVFEALDTAVIDSDVAGSVNEFRSWLLTTQQGKVKRDLLTFLY
jgi:hypothetical protein